MIRPINFTGIKNAGYASVNTYTENGEKSRTILNMQLTDDKNGKDLSEYKMILNNYPSLMNDINDEFVNVEFESENQGPYVIMQAKINGNPIPVHNKFLPLLNFAKKLVNKVANFKPKDFKYDPDHYLMKEAQEGLIYNENIVDYLDGTSGELKLLKGSGLTEKFDRYFNDENVEISDAELDKVNEAADNMVAVLHDPAYVHNGATYLDALMSIYTSPRGKYLS